MHNLVAYGTTEFCFDPSAFFLYKIILGLKFLMFIHILHDNESMNNVSDSSELLS
jgi:hypothetical protein